MARNLQTISTQALIEVGAVTETSQYASTVRRVLGKDMYWKRSHCHAFLNFHIEGVQKV